MVVNDNLEIQTIMTTSKLMIGIIYSLLIVASTPPKIEMHEEKILGIWQDAGHPEKSVKFLKQHEVYIGKSLEENKVIFKDLIYDAISKAYSGKLINPENGKSYKLTINFVDNDTFSFTVKRFIFSKEFTFKSIK